MTAQAGGAIPSSPSSQWAQRIAIERQALRQQLRRTRRELPIAERRKASVVIAHKLARLPLCKPGTRIGIYLALPGELDLQPFIERAWARRCQLFAPHITSARRREMAFYPLTADSALQLHRWGMPQLRHAQRQPISSITLDVVLVPLVGFDANGNRLGMGAGFYDRHFARLSRQQRWRRPHLIGVAFACQQVAALPQQAHDVALEWVITERELIRARR